MTTSSAKELWNAWLIGRAATTQADAIRTLVTDYGYTARGAAALLREARGRHKMYGKYPWDE